MVPQQTNHSHAVGNGRNVVIAGLLGLLIAGAGGFFARMAMEPDASQGPWPRDSALVWTLIRDQQNISRRVVDSVNVIARRQDQILRDIQIIRRRVEQAYGR